MASIDIVLLLLKIFSKKDLSKMRRGRAKTFLPNKEIEDTMNNSAIIYNSKLKYALLVCAFLCGNNADCAEHANTDSAASLGAAFNGDGNPIDVILVSRAGPLQALTSYMQVDDMALIFACLAVNLGVNRKEIRETLEEMVNSFAYEEKCGNITRYLRPKPPQYKSDDLKQAKASRLTRILNQFDDYCSHLPVSAQRDSWKIVVFNETFFSKSILTKNEVDKIRELFFKIVENKKLIAYFNFLYQDEVAISPRERERIYEAIDGDAQFDYKTLNIIKLPKTNFFQLVDNVTVKDILKNKEFADLYRQRIIRHAKTLKGKYRSIFNRTIACYQNRSLCHYDKSSYFGECPNDLINSDKSFYMYHIGAGQDKIIYSPYYQLANVVVSNISSEICYDIHWGIRKGNNWTNKKQPSKLHIFVSNTVDANGDDNLPQDIVTACVDPFGIPARKTGEDKAITGVFKGNQIFPYTAYSFTHKSCNYGIMVVKNIFKVH